MNTVTNHFATLPRLGRYNTLRCNDGAQNPSVEVPGQQASSRLGSEIAAAVSGGAGRCSFLGGGAEVVLI